MHGLNVANAFHILNFSFTNQFFIFLELFRHLVKSHSTEDQNVLGIL